MSKRTCK
jgi:IS5 family transposase